MNDIKGDRGQSPVSSHDISFYGTSLSHARLRSLNAKSKKALKINKTTGKITVKKKTKKGNYKIKVTVTASGNESFNPGSKTVTVSIRVK